MPLGVSTRDEQLDAMSVHTISFRVFPNVEDDDLARLSGLTELRSLDLSNSKLSAAGIGKLKRLVGLHTLDLSGIDLSAFDLSQLESLTLLKRLRVKGVPARDDWIIKLAAWENMKFLDIRDSAVTSIGAKAFIGRRKNVDTYVSPRLFGEYPEIKALLQLGPLRGTIQVDGKPLDVLKAIAALKSGGSITGLTWPIDKKRSVEDVEVLAKLPRLEWIEVSVDAIPAIHFPILKKLQAALPGVTVESTQKK